MISYNNNKNSNNNTIIIKITIMIYKYLETYINIEIMDDNGDKCFCLMVSFFFSTGGFGLLLSVVFSTNSLIKPMNIHYRLDNHRFGRWIFIDFGPLDIR